MIKPCFPTACTTLLYIVSLAVTWPAAAQERPSGLGGAVPKGGVTFAHVPNWDHIVVIVMENRGFNTIIGNSRDAPYLNRLADSGALLTNFIATTHPSQPNYFVLYAGDTFGVRDNKQHSLSGPTLATILKRAGKTFIGYAETPKSTHHHNPWESFPEAQAVGRDFRDFPSDYAALPDVAFVIPNLDNDMHDGSVARGDRWLETQLGGYALWAARNNSLLIVTWDEDEGKKGQTNRVTTILYGAHIARGQYGGRTGHHELLRTILASHGLQAPGAAADAAIIDATDRLPVARASEPVEVRRGGNTRSQR